jgi:ABC-type Fe3+-siderophore transport system permease subunit
MKTMLLTPVAIYAVLSAGCATSYSPREPGRIHFVLNHGGEEALERDGQKYPIGGFSGGQLLAAVTGNSAAEARARAYVDHRQTFSGYAIVTGIALAVVGFLFIGLTAEPLGDAPPESSQSNRNKAGIAMGIAGVIGTAAFIGAAINGEAAQRNLYDAINIYNDGVSSKAR